MVEGKSNDQNNSESDNEKKDHSDNESKNGRVPRHKQQPSNYKEMKGFEFIEEELLIVYYVTILMMMWKIADAQKALHEYKQKEGISLLGLANI